MDDHVDSIEEPDRPELDEYELEFERFGETMDLDFDTDAMDEEDLASFEKLRRTFVRALRDGRLHVDDKGRPVFTPGKGGELIFREPNGDTFLEMDRAKKGRNVMALNLAMAQMTKQAPARFAKMKGRDLRVCHAVMNLFLG